MVSTMMQIPHRQVKTLINIRWTVSLSSVGLFYSLLRYSFSVCAVDNLSFANAAGNRRSHCMQIFEFYVIFVDNGLYCKP